MSAAGSWRRDVEALAREHGCAVEEAPRGGHLVLRHPSGWSVFVSKSPSDWRALQNVRGDLRRKASGVWR